MPDEQPTAADAASQDPFRWPHADILEALDNFDNPDSPSQRAYAQQQGIPHATFNYWMRRYSAAENDPVDSFFASGSGALVLRHILTAAPITFVQRGACGIRLIGDFLQLAKLDRYVATSRGALQPLAAHLESDLVAFRDAEQPLLAQQMKPRAITLVPDEHFHSDKPCLVAIEPVANFIAVECYRDRRDADTWTAAIAEGTRGMPVEIVQLTSDQASALLCCAEKGLHAAHSPDLFHGQRDLLQPLLLPLARPIGQAEKDLEKVQRQCSKLDGPVDEPCSAEEFAVLVEAVKAEQALGAQIEQAKQRQAKAVHQVRGVGDDYHPFDRTTGQPVTADEVGERLHRHLDTLQEVIVEADLPAKAEAAVTKARSWVQTLMGCVAWFWCLANVRVEELELTAEQERAVKEKLLAGHYWEMAAGRARTAAERKRLQTLAAELKKSAWQAGGALSSLGVAEKQEVAGVACECAGLFQRSSSCVEGRNGRLSLQQHGHSRVSERRLKALTVIHNYLVERADGTTAAQRFFGQKHADAFTWLLQRMPDLPRPAAKRPKSAPASLTLPGNPA
jgi:Family of unknown function (DUF6399)